MTNDFKIVESGGFRYKVSETEIPKVNDYYFWQKDSITKRRGRHDFHYTLKRKVIASNNPFLIDGGVPALEPENDCKILKALDELN